MTTTSDAVSVAKFCYIGYAIDMIRRNIKETSIVSQILKSAVICIT